MMRAWPAFRFPIGRVLRRWEGRPAKGGWDAAADVGVAVLRGDPGRAARP